MPQCVERGVESVLPGERGEGNGEPLWDPRPPHQGADDRRLLGLANPHGQGFLPLAPSPRPERGRGPGGKSERSGLPALGRSPVGAGRREVAGVGEVLPPHPAGLPDPQSADEAKDDGGFQPIPRQRSVSDSGATRFGRCSGTGCSCTSLPSSSHSSGGCSSTTPRPSASSKRGGSASQTFFWRFHLALSPRRERRRDQCP
jgi:hypothetical protein